MVGKKVLLSPPPSLSPLARETISSFFHGTMSMERLNSPLKGIYISVGTTELYQSEELCQAAIYCLVFISADAIQQLRCHPEE